MPVTLNTLDDDDYCTKGLPSPFVHSSEREDNKTLEKIKEIEIPSTLLSSPNSLESRASLRKETSEELTEMLQQLELKEFDQLEDLFVEAPDKRGTFLARLQTLVAAILSQLQQLSEKDKKKIDQLEKEYKLHTLTASDLQRKQGWNGLIFAGGSLAISIVQMFLHPEDQQIAKLFAEQIWPKVGDLRGSDLNARLTDANNKASLELNKYTNTSTMMQDQANNKQLLGTVLEKDANLLVQSSRGG